MMVEECLCGDYRADHDLNADQCMRCPCVKFRLGRLVDVRAENARLQADVEHALSMPLNERIDALVVSRDRYKALAERRGETLRKFVYSHNIRGSDGPCDCELCRQADAALATPPETKNT